MGATCSCCGSARSVEVVTRTSLRVPKPLKPLTIRDDSAGHTAARKLQEKQRGTMALIRQRESNISALAAAAFKMSTDADIARAATLYVSVFRHFGLCLYYHHMNPAGQGVFKDYHPVLAAAGLSRLGAPSYEIGLRRPLARLWLSDPAARFSDDVLRWGFASAVWAAQYSAGELDYGSAHYILPACLACGQPTGSYCDGVAGHCGRALCTQCCARFDDIGPCCRRLRWPRAADP